MAGKDIVERHLEEYNDVFSDIVNGLLFKGESVIAPDDLQDTPARSVYKAGMKVHEQERDIAKLWKKEGVVISLIGLENQTEVDPDMPLRVSGYDGAAYRGQLLLDKSDRTKGKVRYPVVSLVLYFGRPRWKKPRTLFGMLKIPERLKPFVTNCRANIFEISWLTDDEISRFKGDFRIVADYFVQMRKNKAYVPSQQVIEHVDAVLKLMSVLTGDDRFERAQNAFAGEEKKMPVTMTSVIDQFIEQGISQGRAEGRREAFLSAAGRMLAKGFSIEETAEIIGLPVDVIMALKK